MPRVVACGGRKQAYDDFCIALTEAKHAAMLLVDSEGPVSVASPWAHLLQRSGDHWPTPTGAADDDCHLMVQCMESWLLADRATLTAFFGQGYNDKALPAAQASVEPVPKEKLILALADATRNCKTKAAYGKGEHSFLLLARIDPARVTESSPWAARFVTTLKAKMGA
jgi:hypothetical protein